MEQENRELIAEKNKRISKALGNKFWWEDPTRWNKGAAERVIQRHYRQLSYHNNWLCLMKVVEDLELYYSCDFTIKRFSCKVDYEKEYSNENYSHSKKDAVYNAVYTFANWILTPNNLKEKINGTRNS